MKHNVRPHLKTLYRLLGRVAALPLILFSIYMIPHASHADSFPVDHGPDRGKHVFCFDPQHPLANAVHSRAISTMNNVESQTIVTTKKQPTCGPKSDVRFQQRPIGTDMFGYAPCRARVAGSSRCDSREARIDWGEIRRLATHDNYQARKTLCHEVGHTLGANHYANWLVNPDGTWASNSCMISGLHDSGDVWTRSYGPHHISHINGWFS